MSVPPKAGSKDDCYPDIVEESGLAQTKPVQRKRRLTLPSNLPRSKELQRNPALDIKVSEDSLIQSPDLSSIDKATSISAESFGQGYPSIPFVLDDGVFSFYSSSSDYSSGSSTRSSLSPLSSSKSDGSFLEAQPNTYTPLPGATFCSADVSPQSIEFTTPCIERLVIWRDDTSTESRHVYAQISLEAAAPLQTLTFDSNSPVVQETFANLSSPLLHLSVPLFSLPRRHRQGISSLITVSASSSNAVFFVMEVYKQGLLVGSYEEEMIEESQSPFGSARFSSAFPQELLDRLYDTANLGEAGQKEISDHLFVMKFLQEGASPGAGNVKDVILVAMTEFCVQPSSGNQITLSYISVDSPSSPFSPTEDLVPSSSPGGLTIPHEAENMSSKTRRRPKEARAFPKLSVAIPPVARGIEGINVYTDSPIISPPHARPQMDMPKSASSIPPTPFSCDSQLTFSSFDTQTPSNLSYPFTLSSTSPRILDLSTLSPGASVSAPPAYQQRGLPFSPFTPSFFQRHPQTARVNSTTLSPVRGRSNDGNSLFSRLSTLESDSFSAVSAPSIYSCESYAGSS